MLLNSKLALAIFCILLVCAGCIETSRDLTFQPSPSQTSANNAAFIENLKKSVVHINYTGSISEPSYDPVYYLIGSGIIYSVEGNKVYVLTNRHVVDLSYSAYGDYTYYDISDEHIYLKTYSGDTFYASDRFIAPNNLDLAIIVFEKDFGSLESAKLSNSKPNVGEDVFVIGMPQQLDWSVSKGIVSGIRKFDLDPQIGSKYTAIQTDAAVNEGNSGGGMFTFDGNLIGINTWKYYGYGVEGLNFAVSISDFLKLKNSFINKPIGESVALVSTDGPVSIGYVDARQQYGYASADDWFDISFNVLDQNSHATSSDGNLTISISDNLNQSLYSHTLAISKSNFKKSADYPFYGSPVYTYKLLFRDINKSSGSIFNVSVQFDFNKTKFQKSTSIYPPTSLVTYNYSTSYSEVPVKIINQSAIDQDVQLTLLSVDKQLSYSDYLVTTSLKNTGSNRKEVEILSATLVTNQNQYSADFYDRRLGTIYPNAAVTKDISFYGLTGLGSDAILYLDLRVIEDDRVKNINYAIRFDPN